jgi:sulfate transport system ATP-binding protein
VYARAADFRVVGEDPAAIAGKVLETQRTGVLMRLTVSLDANGQSVEIEVPNPDPEMQVWLVGDRIRLRPAHFSLYCEHCPEPATIAVDRSADYAAPDSRVRGR